MAKNNISIPDRSDIPSKDQWNLSKLFSSEAEWEAGLIKLEKIIPKISAFKGSLNKSANSLSNCLNFLYEMEHLEERVGYYAHLRTTEDAGNSDNQARFSRYLNISSRIEAAKSYVIPEIQAIPANQINEFLNDPSLKEFKITLNKLLRYKPHILDESRERLMAMQLEQNQTSRKAFSALTDVDLNFGDIETSEGVQPLSQSTFSQFMINPDRKLRKVAYNQFYHHFDQHKNTLATLYTGSVQLDIYQAKVRNHDSSRSAALFPDKISIEVYDNLITTIHKNLPNLHNYYSLRKKALGLSELKHYDVYAPLTKDIQINHTYSEAVEIVINSLYPLGKEYCSILKEGLIGGWVDRYENKGKRSGAFSAGSFVGDPYILMNYKENVLRDVFTLAHEAGHSMHSWYSVRNNPIQHYNYSIFEAEVASTFNEQLLFHYLLKNNPDKKTQIFLIGKQVDDIIATIFRQTMFAEYEHLTHASAEEGNPLTVDSLRALYKQLLIKYFGPEMHLEKVSDLEGLRIPHFYNAFYVYKYATGLSAAIALSNIVLSGGPTEQEKYMMFLKSGGSRYPIDALKVAGVDMSSPTPIQSALDIFANMVAKLENLL